MSNVLRVLGGLASAAGKGFEGYGIDKRERVKNALIQAKEARDAERDRVNDALLQTREARDIEGDRLRNAVTQRTLDTPVAVPRDPIADDATKYAARRQIDINNPLPIRATAPTVDGRAKIRSDYIRDRAGKLQEPTVGLGGLKTPSKLTREQAEQSAALEFDNSERMAPRVPTNPAPRKPVVPGAGVKPPGTAQLSKGEAPDDVLDAAIAQFGGDTKKAAAHLRAQGYR